MANTVVFFEPPRKPKIDKQPGDKGTRWAEDELEKLLDLFDGGATAEEILPQFRRSLLGIIGMLVKHKRLVHTPEGLARRDPFLWASSSWIERYRNERERPKNPL